MFKQNHLYMTDNHDDSKTQSLAQFRQRCFTFSEAKSEISNPMFSLTLSDSSERTSKEFGFPQRHGSKLNLDFSSVEKFLTSWHIFSTSFYNKAISETKYRTYYRFLGFTSFSQEPNKSLKQFDLCLLTPNFLYNSTKFGLTSCCLLFSGTNCQTILNFIQIFSLILHSISFLSPYRMRKSAYGGQML